MVLQLIFRLLLSLLLLLLLFVRILVTSILFLKPLSESRGQVLRTRVGESNVGPEIITNTFFWGVPIRATTRVLH